MRFGFRGPSVFLIAVALLSGCDRTPTDTTLDGDPETTLLNGNTDASVFASSATSLSSLLRTAVAKVEAEKGPAAVRQLLETWRRLQEEAQSAVRGADRQRAQAKIAAIRAEEIRIVLLVLGNDVAFRTTAAVGEGLAHVRMDLSRAEAAGRDVTRAKELTAQVAEALHKANGALESRDAAKALDFATQASELLDNVVHFLIALERIPALESLFADAIAKVAREKGRQAALTLTATLTRLNDEARAALRAGDRQTAARKLEAVRKEQIRIVLEVFGSGVVAPLIERVDAAIAATRARVASSNVARVVEQAQRMLKEAADLNSRARTAHGSGDMSTALDLASHAAGLVNAIQHLLPR
jgi:hypothetical protein